MSHKYERFRKDGFVDSPGSVGPVLDLMRRFGVWGLAGADGCACADFSLYGIEVSISCHKAERSVRVSCPSMEGTRGDLKSIAVEALWQLRDTYGYEEPFKVRFCSYEYDHVGGHWEGGRFVETQKCCYCGEPRPDPTAYLCSKCVVKKEALMHYPWTGFESSFLWNLAARGVAAIQ